MNTRTMVFLEYTTTTHHDIIFPVVVEQSRLEEPL